LHNYKNLVFICDLGQANPRVVGLAREMARLDVRVYVVTPSMTNAQKKIFGISASEPWTYLPIPGIKMDYRRNIGYRKFVLAPRRILIRRFGNKKGKWKSEKEFAERITLPVRELLISKNLVGESTVLISSSGPFRYHIVASSVSQELSTAWVADYRDMWSLNHANSKDINKAQLRFEKETLAGATALISVSIDLLEESKNIFSGPVLELQNGHPGMRKILQKNKNPIVILYTGQIYDGFQRLDLFLEGLSKIMEEKLNGFLKIQFAGPSQKNVRNYYKSRRLVVPSWITFLGEIPRETSLDLQSKSDFLLTFKWEDEEYKNLYSTKIYEYISSGRPTLVVGSIQGEAVGNLVTRAKAGYVLNSSEEVFHFISRLLDGNSTPFNPDIELINQLSYEALATKLHKFLDSL
jgi:hypothetical protein